MGNRVFHRWWDGTRSCIDVVDSFPLELYIHGKTHDSTSIYGDPLSRMTFTQPSDMKGFIEEHQDLIEIHGQTSIAHQFISHTYPGEIDFSMKGFVIANLDIETKYDNTGFPNPHQAKQEISAITVKIAGASGFVTFGTKAYEPVNEDMYFRAENEELMLVSFIGWWSRTQPDIITGWNVAGFDIPYLVNRLVKVLGEGIANKLSPFHNRTKNVFTETKLAGDDTSYRILGITVYDYLELYKKFTLGSRESYSLDFICQYELGVGKIEFEGDLMNLYNTDHQKYIEYNIHDVRLVEMLDEKMAFLQQAIAVAYTGKVKFHEIFGQVKWWDTHIYNELLLKNIQIPPQPATPNHEGIEGAFVKDARPALYKWLMAVDLTSLYPSILMAGNMSPETLVVPGSGSIIANLIKMARDTSDLKSKNLTLLANGSQYKRDVIGFMPTITENMFKKRKALKKKMLAVGSEIELITAECARRAKLT